jgi:hypothetical protein
LNENWDEDVRADMSDALDRIVPEDKKRQGLYRHDAEGSDDMPVRLVMTRGLGVELMKATGTCQVRIDRRERYDSDYEWKIGDGDMAGYLVSGVSRCETLEKGGGYDSGGEDVTGSR